MLGDGSDSPVSGASSTSSPREPSTRASAGTRSPGRSSTMSPGTTRSASSCARTPSRTHRRPLGHERGERLDRASGPPLLDEADRAVGHHDGENDGAVGDLAERERDGAGGDQNEDQRAGELAPQQHR